MTTGELTGLEALEALKTPTPARTAAAAAIAGGLNRELSVCADRAAALSYRLLDSAVDVAAALYVPPAAPATRDGS